MILVNFIKALQEVEFMSSHSSSALVIGAWHFEDFIPSSDISKLLA